jgi:co-chaperonin GroES (HSP10)
MTEEQPREHKILLNGSKLLVRRFKVPEKTESGIIVPNHYLNQKESVSEVHNLDPYQKRGVIESIGISVSESFKEHYKIGDIVCFGPNACMPVPLRRDVIDEDSPYALIEEWAIDWKETD